MGGRNRCIVGCNASRCKSRAESNCRNSSRQLKDKVTRILARCVGWWRGSSDLPRLVVDSLTQGVSGWNEAGRWGCVAEARLQVNRDPLNQQRW